MIFIFSYSTVILLNNQTKIGKRELLYIGIFLGIYIMLEFIFKVKFEIYTIIQIWLFAIILILMLNKEKLEKIKIYNIAIMVIFTLGLGFGVVFRYDSIGQNTVKEYMRNNEVDEKQETLHYTIHDFKSAIDYIKKKDEGFYRIMKSPYNAVNSSLWMGYNSIGAYFSIMPETYQKISKDLLNNGYYRLNLGVSEFDYRTKIGSLLCEKYLIINNKNTIPYGYSKLEGYKGTSEIYENKYNLPFGVLYTNYINRAEYEALSPLDKESCLLKTTVIEEKDINLEHFNYESKIKEVEYRIVDDNEVMSKESTIISTENKSGTKLARLGLEIEELEKSELYLYIKGIKYTPSKSTSNYGIGVKIEDILKIHETKDKNTPYFVDNRRDFV